MEHDFRKSMEGRFGLAVLYFGLFVIILLTGWKICENLTPPGEEEIWELEAKITQDLLNRSQFLGRNDGWYFEPTEPLLAKVEKSQRTGDGKHWVVARVKAYEFGAPLFEVRLLLKYQSVRGEEFLQSAVVLEGATFEEERREAHRNDGTYGGEDVRGPVQRDEDRDALAVQRGHSGPG